MKNKILEIQNKLDICTIRQRKFEPFIKDITSQIGYIFSSGTFFVAGLALFKYGHLISPIPFLAYVSAVVILIFSIMLVALISANSWAIVCKYMPRCLFTHFIGYFSLFSTFMVYWAAISASARALPDI